MEREEQEKQIRMHVVEQLMQANALRRSYNETPHTLDQILTDAGRISTFIIGETLVPRKKTRNTKFQTEKGIFEVGDRVITNYGCGVIYEVFQDGEVDVSMDAGGHHVMKWSEIYAKS